MSSALSSFFSKVRESLVSAVLRSGFDLFLISVLILFLELACIRWFPAHVVFLTFFTNVVLLACFIGMSVGCLAASHKRNWIYWTPLLLAVVLGLALLLEFVMNVAHLRDYLDVGRQDRPDVVYFGTEYTTNKLETFSIPIEVVGGLFFVLIALVFVGPGQELGRALTRVPNRVIAYTINIGGSIVGIVLIGLISWLELSPLVWFGLASAGLVYFLWPRGVDSPPLRRCLLAAVPLVFVITSVGLHNGSYLDGQHHIDFFWSPYYRIDYQPPSRIIEVNQIGHQAMASREYYGPEYALPHALHRDIQEQLGPGQEPKPFQEILIIGAGSGNDVSRALEWDVGHIDAVEIDPVIYRLGKANHPLRPYDDPRVTVHLNDGRNFLRNAPEKKYDLVIYALVDSLVLHSGYSNIRLESYLFTKEAFQDIKRCLKPDGMFVTYNYFRQGWIVARLKKTLEDNEVFGEGNTVVFAFPFLEPEVFRTPYVPPEVDLDSPFAFGVLFAGPGVERMQQAFQKSAAGEYWMEKEPPSPVARPCLARTPNGFTVAASKKDELAAKLKPLLEKRKALEQSTLPPEEKQDKLYAVYQEIDREQRWWRFGPAAVHPPAELEETSDNWPFLYVRHRQVPLRPSLTGMIVMAVLALGLLLLFLPRQQNPANGDTVVGTSNGNGSRKGWGFDVRMFFLGAGFMLIETKAVVHMALLFGSTWIVNSVVFFAVLVMILLANLFVLKVKVEHLWPYYIGLFITLALNAFIPLHWFLSLDRPVQIVASCLMVFAPIAFAGVIFATAFRKTAEPDRAFGANIAGAMLGGLAENTSMLLGFQMLVLVAIGFYALSAVGAALGWIGATKEESVPAQTA